MRGFWFAAPFWTLGLTFNEEAAYRSGLDFLLVLVISTAGTAAMGLVMLSAHLTVLRDRERVPVSVSTLAVVAITASWVRLAVVVWMLDALGMPDTVPLVQRVIGSAILAVVAFAVMAYASWAWSRYADERRRLLAEIIDSEGQLTVHRVAIEAMSSALVTQVERRVLAARIELGASLQRLSDAIDGGSSGVDEFRRMRQVSDENWRRLAADTWSGAPLFAPRVRFRELVETIVNGIPFAPRYHVVAGFLLYIFVFSRVASPVDAVVATLLWTGICSAVALVANRTIARIERGRTRVLGAAIALQGSTIMIVLLLGFLPTDDAALVLRVVIVVSLTLMLVVGAGVPSAVALQQSRILGVLSHHLDESTLRRMRVESEFVTLSQRLATRLHGHERGSFLASTLRLKAALDEADPERARQIIRAMRDDLEHPVDPQSIQPRDRGVLEEFLANWAGIIRIDVCPEIADLPAQLHEAVHTIIIDAVTNAVRHGKCTRVTVDLSMQSESLHVRVDSDGSPPLSGRRGLGSINLDRFALGGWHRSVGELGGTLVTAVIPLPAGSAA